MPQTTTLDLEHLRGWIGRTEMAEDLITPRLVGEFRAMLDLPEDHPDGDAPLGLHWCLAPPAASGSKLGRDGHPARGGFLPPVPLPRRMWAGGRLEFALPFQVGDLVQRRSVICDVTAKSGRTGVLCFVTVEHDYSTSRGLALRERQDIVYREAPPKTAPGAPPADPSAPERPTPSARREVVADPVLLFRYSALTFNGHRIHYDQAYATDVEGYPGLVVHGPLQATLLLQLTASTQGVPRNFSFRGVRPLIAGPAFSVNAAAGRHGGVELWTASNDGTVHMMASA